MERRLRKSLPLMPDCNLTPPCHRSNHLQQLICVVFVFDLRASTSPAKTAVFMPAGTTYPEYVYWLEVPAASRSRTTNGCRTALIESLRVRRARVSRDKKKVKKWTNRRTVGDQGLQKEFENGCIRTSVKEHHSHAVARTLACEQALGQLLC